MINTLINESLICLNLKASSKELVFEELADMLVKNGKVNNREQFIADVKAREELGNTGFDEGIALPHAKSAAVISPAVAIGISHAGKDYGAEDGELSKLFFMIASPANGGDHHIDVLTSLSSKLIEEGFIDKIMQAKSSREALSLLLAKKETVIAEEGQNKGIIIGVTGCPAGIAHTYLAAEALENAGAAMGYEMKVETNGSIGVKDSPTEEEIRRADGIIVSCDKQVDMARFAGKKLIKTSVKEPIKNAQK